MSNAIQLAILIVFFASLAGASSSCPVTLVSAAAEPDAITVTFLNAGKLPIRQLEFNCALLRPHTPKAQPPARCREQNALFFPGTEYTVRYAYPGGNAKPVRVSLKNVTLSNGYVWKPTRRQPCRVLNVYPGKKKKRP